MMPSPKETLVLTVLRFWARYRISCRGAFSLVACVLTGSASGVSFHPPPGTAESCPLSPPVPAPTWYKAGVSSLFARKNPLPSMGGIFCQTSEEVLLALTAAQADANAAAAANTIKYRREYECARQDCWRLLDSKQLSPTALEKETYRLWLA